MKGYILNLTIRGEGVINNQGKQFVCRPGDILLFPPGEVHHYGRHPDASEWYHQWVYFRPRAYWQEWLTAGDFLHRLVFRPDEAHQPHFNELFGQIISAGQRRGVTLSCWRSICWNNCCSDVWKQLMNRCIPMDNRVRDACQYISDHGGQQF